MSSTYSFLPRSAASSGSPSRPQGLGVSKVWCSSHQSCQRVSMSWARAAVYLNGGVSVVVSVACSVVLIPGDQPTGARPLDVRVEIHEDHGVTERACHCSTSP